MSSGTRGRARRGRGRGLGRGSVAENEMDHHETSAPSSPSNTSDREDNVEFTPEQVHVACYVEPAESVSSTLLNPKINHRSDAIFGDQVNLRITYFAIRIIHFSFRDNKLVE